MARFEEQPFELINGQSHLISIELKHHAKVRNMLFKNLLLYENTTKVGEVFSRQLTVIVDDSGYVRNAYYPDVIFINHPIDDDDEKPILVAPDLLAEVISPTDKYTDINSKIDAYLSDGVKLIWIVDPQRKTIAFYESNDTAKILRIDDTLTGGDVLPNFELSAKDIFS